MKRNPKTLTLVTTAVLALALIGLIAWQRFTPAQAETTEAFTGDFGLEAQPLIGSPEAPVTIVAFEDFKCPVCKAFEDESYPRIIRELVETGKAKMYFMNFQFIGPDSTTAGIAGECAYRQDEGAFWDYKTYIYRSQGAESETWATPEHLVNIARENVPALDSDALAACIDEGSLESAVSEDYTIGQQAGVTGTPTLFVNGEKLESWDYATVQAAVEAAQP